MLLSCKKEALGESTGIDEEGVGGCSAGDLRG
jgi:hypothetical protein